MSHEKSINDGKKKKSPLKKLKEKRAERKIKYIVKIDIIVAIEEF